MADSKCPECGERMSFGAIRCACGWGAKKLSKGERNWDHRCTFQAGGDRCHYPVGMFPEGASSGWCIFHRSAEASMGAEIVRQSASVPYARALEPIQAQNAKSPSVLETAHAIALRHGNKPWQADLEQIVQGAKAA